MSVSVNIQTSWSVSVDMHRMQCKCKNLWNVKVNDLLKNKKLTCNKLLQLLTTEIIVRW